MINLNIFGIKMAGVDVCGFQEETNEELCVRWHQIGAFLYSFFRNHNTIGGKK
jgi:alpha-glucosidase (family GH31 glycosyl hydrolase)